MAANAVLESDLANVDVTEDFLAAGWYRSREVSDGLATARAPFGSALDGLVAGMWLNRGRAHARGEFRRRSLVG